MIACLMQALPNKTAQEIKQVVTQSSDRFLNPTYQFGYGIPDFNLALSQGLSTTTFLDSNCFVYPNPTSDSVAITLPSKSSFGSIKIYTLLGRSVLENTISNQQTTVSLKSLEKGIYFYKLELDGFLKRGKIIKL
jgi:hypothetical protein